MSGLRLALVSVVLVLTGGFLTWGVWSQSTHTVQRSYLGFDLNEYPGDEALPTLRKTFSFSGYWLSPPPGQKSNSWLGKRAALKAQGFGFLVLYNGRLIRELKSIADAEQKGAIDGRNAARRARQEGFVAGTIIFLDIEEGGRLPRAYHEYVKAWVDAIVRERFRAGAYCSGMPVNEGGGITIVTVDDLRNHLGGRKLEFFVYNDACPPSPGCVFPDKGPEVVQSGAAGAVIWQYAQSPRRKEFTAPCAKTYAPDGNCYAPSDTAHKWLLDANVATSANPSAAP